MFKYGPKTLYTWPKTLYNTYVYIIKRADNHLSDFRNSFFFLANILNILCRGFLLLLFWYYANSAFKPVSTILNGCTCQPVNLGGEFFYYIFFLKRICLFLCGHLDFHCSPDPIYKLLLYAHMPLTNHESLTGSRACPIFSVVRAVGPAYFLVYRVAQPTNQIAELYTYILLFSAMLDYVLKNKKGLKMKKQSRFFH